MEAIFALAIPALVKAVELANHKQWVSLGKIILAAAVGVVGGLVGVFPDVVQGLGFGLSAAGVVTVASRAGVKDSVSL